MSRFGSLIDSGARRLARFAAGRDMTTDEVGRTEAGMRRPRRPEAGVRMADRRLELLVDPASYGTPQAIQYVLRQAEYGEIGLQLEMGARMVERDAHLGSVIQTRREAIERTTRTLKPPPGLEADQRALKAVDYCTEVLSQLRGFDEGLGTLTEAVFYGFRALEIEWDGQVPVALWETLDAGWRYRQNAGLELESAPGRWEPCPLDKFLIYSPRGGSPDLCRRGALRAIARYWLLKNLSTVDWSTFVEKFGVPPLHGKYPASWPADGKDVANLEAGLAAIGADGYLVTPEKVEIAALIAARGGGAGGWTPHQGLIDWIDRQYSKRILGQTLTTDTSGSTGTYAAASVHNEVRLDLAQSDARKVARTLRTDLLAPIVGYGLGWDWPVPVLVLEVEDQAEEMRSGEKLDTAVNRLGLPVAAAEAYRLLRLRAPEPEEEVLAGAPKAAAPELPFSRGGGRFARTAASDSILGEVPLALEALASFSAAEWEATSHGFLTKAVRDLVARDPSMTPAQAVERLAAWYPSLDREEMAETIAAAVNAALVNGMGEMEHETDGALSGGRTVPS